MKPHDRFHHPGCWGAVLTLAMACAAVSVSSDDGPVAPSIRVPPTINVPFLLDSTGAAVALERQTSSTELKENMGLPGGRFVTRLADARSPVRIVETPVLAFVIRIAGTNPNKWRLFSVNSKKNRREFVPMKGGLLGGREGPGRVPLEVATLSESTFKLIPSRVLHPGEYVFFEEAPFELYCFGIDRAK